jgi:hypothetical protein
MSVLYIWVILQRLGLYQRHTLKLYIFNKDKDGDEYFILLCQWSLLINTVCFW